MWKIFKRRKESQPEAPPLPPCMHTWKDFPWYMDWQFKYNFDGASFGTLTVNIIEPYVCAHCGKRNNIILTSLVKSGVEGLKAKEYAERMVADYKDHMQPKVIVEDMVHDFIYVDPEKLNILEKLRKSNAEKIKLKIEGD